MSSQSVFPREFGDELLLHIFGGVPPEDNLRSLQLVCRKFYTVANDQTIWKRNCITSFRYWKDLRWFKDKVSGDQVDMDWKEVWLRRKRTNTHIGKLFDGMLETKVGRLQRFREICAYGYDAKDFLLDQWRTPDDAEDVLSRRYFAMNILDSLHRAISIEVWSRLQEADNPPSIDQAFGAFDMFVLHEQPQDLDYISRWFEDAAITFRNTQGNWHHAPTREKALALARWMREQGFRGIRQDEHYRDLRNCFIGHALSEPEHPALPLVQSAIFVAIASRLGLSAACCNAPAHVHVVVSSPPGLDLDNNPLPETDENSHTDRMYLDPYASPFEIQADTLEERRQLLLATSPIPTPSAAFYDPSPLAPLIVRMGANLRQTAALAKRLPEDSPAAHHLKALRAGDPDHNAELSFYSSLWSALLASSPTSPDWDAGLEFFLNRFALYYSEDAWIVERHLLPLYDRFVALPAQAGRHRVGWENVREILRMLDNLDRRRPAVNRRYTEEIGRRVLYRIGQVFRHRRYRYVGVINGWAASGLGSLPTPHYVVDEEGGGDGGDDDDDGGAARGEGGGVRGWWEGTRWREGGTTYYTCLRPNCDRLRLAQDSIEIITDPSLIPKQLFFMAGKFFKRFDRETCTFVSNIREFYPDD